MAHLELVPTFHIYTHGSTESSSVSIKACERSAVHVLTYYQHLKPSHLYATQPIAFDDVIPDYHNSLC
jgi:hypothetical protein